PGARKLRGASCNHHAVRGTGAACREFGRSSLRPRSNPLLPFPSLGTQRETQRKRHPVRGSSDTMTSRKSGVCCAPASFGFASDWSGSGASMRRGAAARQQVARVKGEGERKGKSEEVCRQKKNAGDPTGVRPSFPASPP